jgi:hypothetical protein
MFVITQTIRPFEQVQKIIIGIMMRLLAEDFPVKRLTLFEVVALY